MYIGLRLRLVFKELNQQVRIAFSYVFPEIGILWSIIQNINKKCRPIYPSGSLIPLISDSTRTASAKVSATRIYKSVLTGHPCLIPLERLK